MHSIGIRGVAGGELVIMEAPRMRRLSTRATTDRPRTRVFTVHPITDLRPAVAAELRHQLMVSAMAPAAAVAVRRPAVILAVRDVPLVRVALVHVWELHLQAR
jgi:hypothetical protein